MLKVSDFMMQLMKMLIDTKKISENSASLYINQLLTLNNKDPFNNLIFLKNTQNIESKLAHYKDNTKKTYLSGITSILSLYKDKPTYKKIYEHYFNLMMNKANDMKKENINEKSDAQTENWMTWENILNVKSHLKEIVIPYFNSKFITPHQFENLLNYVVLCLYTDIPPRRNQDYLDMFFVPEYSDKMPQNQNYLDWKNKCFIFLKYKTSKKYGKQIISFKDNEELISILSNYLKFHPLNPNASLNKLPKNTMFKFLVFSDGSPLAAVNAITRILNKVFGRKLGSSMLRHIYLTSKYDIKGMKDDAEAMGHSLNEQKQYLKEDDIDTDPEIESPKNKNKFKTVKLG